MEIFENLSHFPYQMMLRNGDYSVDAHSLIGVFSLDIKKPIELMMEHEPDEVFLQAISKFTLSRV